MTLFAPGTRHPSGAPRRERVTVDLRGLGARLQAQAAARNISAASLVRQALLATLEDAAPEAASSGVSGEGDKRMAKFTLRLPAPHARLLAHRARSADVSLGSYVAGLLDGAPPVPLPLDHSEAVLQLGRSTDQLALLNADLVTAMRRLDAGLASDSAVLQADLAQLIAVVRHHLPEAAALVAALKPARRQ